MNRKVFLLGVVMLIAGQLFAEQKLHLVTLKADGTEITYPASDVQRIVFTNNSMTLNMKSASDVTGVASVRFLFMDLTGIGNTKSKLPVYVFPNPVKTNLTVSGVDENVKISLFNLNGTLLRTTVTQENSTDVDVSSLQQGLYLLQVGEQVFKFTKQ